MKELRVDSVDELSGHLTSLGAGQLFRGQTQHHTVEGQTSLTSSFERKGCIPPTMLKWIFYTREMLRRGGVDVEKPNWLSLVQGLLQHYGWRSFYVDLTSDPAVAAWFASHRFTSRRTYELCEDTDERPVMMVTESASYIEHESDGHLYVLDPAGLKSAGHDLVSLEDDLATDTASRFEKQKAWLAGIFLKQRRLAIEAIATHFTGPAKVFAEFAATHGFRSTDDLFPAPSDDVLLKNLLALPWLRLPLDSKAPFPFYRRDLGIPEYQHSLVKHLPPSTALFTPFWTSDIRPLLKGEISIRAPEEVFYGSVDVAVPIPRLAGYLREANVVQIESANLISYPIVPGTTDYAKGVWIERTGEATFDISGVAVGYESSHPTGIGVDRSYSYELVEDILKRVPSPTDCPCGDPFRHHYHLSAAVIVDQMLRDRGFVRTGPIIRIK